MLTSLLIKATSLVTIAVLITSCSNSNDSSVNLPSTDTNDSNNEATNIPHEPALLERKAVSYTHLTLPTIA